MILILFIFLSSLCFPLYTLKFLPLHSCTGASCHRPIISPLSLHKCSFFTAAWKKRHLGYFLLALSRFFIVSRVGTFNFSLKDVLFGTWWFLSLVEWNIAHHHNTRGNITARDSEMSCHSPYVLLQCEAMGFLYCPSCQQHCTLTMGATTESWCCRKAFTHFKRCRAFIKTEVVEWLKTSKEDTVRMEGMLEV